MNNDSPYPALITESLINLLFSWTLIQYSPSFLFPYIYIILLPYRVVESYWEPLVIKFFILFTTLLLVLIFNLLDTKSVRKIRNPYMFIPIIFLIWILLLFGVFYKLIGEHGTPEYFLYYYVLFIIENIVVIKIIHNLLDRYVFVEGPHQTP